jgi:hypothetical protein
LRRRRAKGCFTGRELYFHDPSGNRLEIRDPTWRKGMPEPSFEEIARSRDCETCCFEV